MKNPKSPEEKLDNISLPFQRKRKGGEQAVLLTPKGHEAEQKANHFFKTKNMPPEQIYIRKERLSKILYMISKEKRKSI